MKRLKELGFKEFLKNIQLCKKHKGDMDEIIEALDLDATVNSVN